MAGYYGVMPARYNITYYCTLLIGDIYSSKRILKITQSLIDIVLYHIYLIIILILIL